MDFFLQGLMLGAALILPLGPQNTLVLRLGMARHYGWTAATFCVVSDIALITSGVVGGSAFLQHSPLLLLLITWAGVLFLLWYSVGIIREITMGSDHKALQPTAMSLNKVLLTLTAVTWLNPHVYLDTFVLLGSIGSQIPAQQRLVFVMGAISASIVWFYLLAGIARRLSVWLLRPRIQTLISLIVLAILVSMAFRLAVEGVLMWKSYL